MFDSSPPQFMTCGELVRQDDKYILEYASLYGIPGDVSRSEMLERIIILNPGSEACIPILKHFTAERGADGRVRLTGRASPIPEPPNKPPIAVPTSRRLTRQSVKKHVLNDLSQRESPTLSHAPSSQSSASPGSSDRPPSPALSSKVTPPPNDISIIPQEVNPAVRFSTPFDTYSPGPSSPESGIGGARSFREGSPSVKPMMEFVYPPRPRPSRKDGNNSGASDREPSPGPNWLHKMLYDLQRGRTTLKSELADLTREANDAVAEIMKIQVLRDQEAKEMKQFLADLRKVVGPDVVQDIIESATEAAEERTSDEEEEEGEEGESGKDNSNSDSQKTDSDSSSSDEDNDDGHGDRDGGQAEGETDASEEEDDAASNEGDGEQNIDHLGLDTSLHQDLLSGDSDQRIQNVSLTRPRDLVEPEGRTSSNSSDDILSGPTEAPGETRAVSSDPLIRPARRDTGSSRKDTSLSNKRGADSDSESGPSSPKRSRLSPPQDRTPKTQPSPSRKRARDSDDSDSAWEVEESVRLTGDENSSGGPYKKPRSDINPRASPTSPSPGPSRNGRNIGNGSPGESEDNFDRKVEREQLNHSDDGDDEETGEGRSPADPADIVSDPSNDGSLNPSPESPALPRFRSRLPAFGSMPWPESSAATSQPTAGPSSQPMQGSSSTSGLAQPSAGPANPRQRPRGLTRARERLRPTAEGDVEAYNYDEGSDYEHRLEREAQTLAAWRRYDAPRSHYPFETEFDIIRGARNEPIVTFADEEEDEEEVDKDKGSLNDKGKGKENA